MHKSLILQTTHFISIYSMKRILLSVAAVFCCLSAIGQTRTELYNRFNKAIALRDTTAVASVITEWKSLFPNDAELYSLRANKHFLSAMKEVIAYTKNKEEAIGEYVAAKDQEGVDTYIYSYIEYDKEKMNCGTRVLSEGIAKHPDRLDLRLGKITLHLKLEEHALAVLEIRSALLHSLQNNNQWYGALDEPIVTDGVSYLRDCIQEYLSILLNAGDLASAENMVDYSLETYPKEVMFIANKGAIKYFANELKESLKWYLAASEIAPNDMMIVTNVGNIYNDLEDRQNAIKYYRIVSESDNNEYEKYIEYAKSKIQELDWSK